MTDPGRYDEFSRFVQQVSGQVVTYLQAVLLDWNDAEDVFQESCLVLWEKFDEFEPGTKISLAGRSASRRTKRCTFREVGGDWPSS